MRKSIARIPKPWKNIPDPNSGENCVFEAKMVIFKKPKFFSASGKHFQDSGMRAIDSPHKIRGNRVIFRKKFFLTITPNKRPSPCEYCHENLKNSIFSRENQFFLRSLMRRIDCARFRSIKTTSRHQIWQLLAENRIFCQICSLNQGQGSVFKVRECAQSIPRIKLGVIGSFFRKKIFWKFFDHKGPPLCFFEGLVLSCQANNSKMNEPISRWLGK